jgi:hypothetical protein
MRQVRAATLCCVLSVAAVPLLAAEAPPREVTDRLERGLKALEPGSFQGTYTLEVSSRVSKLDGSDPKPSTERLEAVQPASGDALMHVVHAEEDGKDVTARRQRELKAQQAKRHARSDKEGGDSSGSVSVSASLPAGEDAARFEFSPPTREGELLVASFSPRPEHREREGITSGRLAWREDTLDPVWVEASPVKLPRHASEVAMRFELDREGELLYLRRVITDGAGGILFIKRRVHAEMEFSEVHQAR